MSCYFFFNHPPTTEISTLSLHDALPIYVRRRLAQLIGERREEAPLGYERERPQACALDQLARAELGEPVTIGRPVGAVEERYREHRGTAGRQDARDLPHRGLRGDDVLEHLDAHDPVRARVTEGQSLGVADDVRALARLEIETYPAPGAVERRPPATARHPLGADLQDHAAELRREPLELGVEEHAAVAEPERRHSQPDRARRLSSSISSATSRTRS